jgi:Protein of unknown function (DUF4058)
MEYAAWARPAIGKTSGTCCDEPLSGVQWNGWRVNPGREGTVAMAIPFPGIDPYLESQGYWPDFHASLILYCRDALNDVLPDSYEARLAAQLRSVELNEPPVRTVLPDVAILEHPTIGRLTSETQAAVLTVEPVTMGLPVAEVEEVRDLWIEIRHRPDRQLITAIELLSPWNKNGEGYWEYRAKRRRLIRQNVNLVELDLLVRGQRLPMDQELPRADYYAFISRAERRPQSDVFAWSARQALPRIPIPLRPPNADVRLDLPSLLALGYERGRYARALDYSAPLELPLAPADRAWAEGVAGTKQP